MLAWRSLYVNNGAARLVRPGHRVESCVGRRQLRSLPRILFCQLVFRMNLLCGGLGLYKIFLLIVHPIGDKFVGRLCQKN